MWKIVGTTWFSPSHQPLIDSINHWIETSSGSFYLFHFDKRKYHDNCTPLSSNTVPIHLSVFANFLGLDAEEANSSIVSDLEIAAAGWRRMGRIVTAQRENQLALAAVRAIIGEAAPSLVMTWGTAALTSRLLYLAAQELGIPTLVWERGLVSGTLRLDSNGILHDSELAKFQLRDENQPSVAAQQASTRLLSRLGAVARPNEARRGTEETRVLFLGSHPAGSLIEMANTRLKGSPEAFSSSHVGTIEAIIAACEAATESYRLTVRPHPVDPTEEKDTYPSWVRFDRISTILSLIENSDVVIGFNSSSLFSAIALGKPVYVLSDYEFEQLGVVRRCSTPIDCLEDYSKSRWKPDVSKINKIFELVERYLFFLDDEEQILRKKIIAKLESTGHHNGHGADCLIQEYRRLWDSPALAVTAIEAMAEAVGESEALQMLNRIYKKKRLLRFVPGALLRRI